MPDWLKKLLHNPLRTLQFGDNADQILYAQLTAGVFSIVEIANIFPEYSIRILTATPTPENLAIKIPWLSLQDIIGFWHLLEHKSLTEDIQKSMSLGSEWLRLQRLLAKPKRSAKDLENIMKLVELFKL